MAQRVSARIPQEEVKDVSRSVRVSNDAGAELGEGVELAKRNRHGKV